MIGFGQQTYVPDNNFEDYLETHRENGAIVNIGSPLSMGNGIANDDSVTTANIEWVMELDVSNQDIADLTGIEDFHYLENLYCDSNQITILDLSQNINLRHVECSYSPNLTSVNVDSLIFLEHLFCQNNNHLTSLSMRYSGAAPMGSVSHSNINLSHNNLETIDWFGADIDDLFCKDNQLTSLSLLHVDFNGYLDCSKNLITSLTIGASDIDGLICDSNFITTLDISNSDIDEILICHNNPYLTNLNIQNGKNIEIHDLSIFNTPQLTCIKVDDSIYAANTWTVANGNIDPQHYFSNNCSGTTSIQEHTTNKELLKVTDLLGRETKGTKNEILFYIYDDGTVEKKIVFIE